MISMMLIEHDLPNSFVERKRFRELIQYSHPHAKIPSRHVATSNINKMYECEKRLKETHQHHSDLYSEYLLQYWMENKVRFPELALMACDILSIQITNVASELAFSIGSRVLNIYLTLLLAKNVQALICTRNWKLGFDWHGKYLNYLHRCFNKLFTILTSLLLTNIMAYDVVMICRKRR
uniref:AC transposase n=1 Tax=Cajanus cajan TaxID=3821 RepID=A0A151RB74_CAJCA|nr:Putative AC transposase [Cajanus cajan]